MGTPEFAVASLEALLKNDYNVVAVVTAPDKPAGRGQQLHQSAVKKYALENNLKLLQPEKLKSPTFISELEKLNIDLQIVVAFRMLPEIVWNLPKHGTYNLHGSLLPKYRGAAPINWAIINGENKTGVTTFKLKQEIDTGNILFNEEVEISNTTTAGDLHDTLMIKGAALVVKTVKAIQTSINENVELEFIAQDDHDVCHAPKIFKETCKINWNDTNVNIYNLIRGLSPFPTAYSEIRTGSGTPQLVKIFYATFENFTHNEANGSLATDNKTFMRVFCKRGFIEITDLQLQGKKRMKVQDFLRGFKIEDDTIFF